MATMAQAIVDVDAKKNEIINVALVLNISY